MAKVVGLVVGLASFSVQLVESTKKLKALCEDIRDAPVKLQDTIGGIEILSEIISLMAPVDGHPYDEGAVLARSMDLCRKALGRLSAVTNDLQIRLQSSNKIRGRLSVMFKKDSMDCMIARLDQCKGLLQLAHQLYMAARHMSRLDCQERILEDLRDRQMMLVSHCTTTFASQILPTGDQQAGQVEVPVQTESVTATQWRRRRDGQHEAPDSQRSILSIRLRNLGWTFSRVLQLTVAQVPVGWTASLQFYRIGVHPRDPFWADCKSDDLVAVKELLQASKATVRDQNEFGITALEWAMNYGAFDVSRYLYQHGSPPSRDSHMVYKVWISYWQRIASTRSPR